VYDQSIAVPVPEICMRSLIENAAPFVTVQVCVVPLWLHVAFWVAGFVAMGA
jgi:hypothetical protein